MDEVEIEGVVGGERKWSEKSEKRWKIQRMDEGERERTYEGDNGRGRVGMDGGERDWTEVEIGRTISPKQDACHY